SRMSGLFTSSVRTRSEPAACPRCGAPLIPPGLALPPIKKRILDAVRRQPGISAEELRCVAWAHDPAGGPENPKVLHVHVHQLNRLIAPLGVAVRGGSNGYRLIPPTVAGSANVFPAGQQERAQLGGVRSE